MKQLTSKLSLDKKTIIQMGAMQQNKVNGGADKSDSINTVQSALHCDTMTCCSYSLCSAFFCDTQE